MNPTNTHQSTVIQPAASDLHVRASRRPRAFWELRGEASLNWLALGLLLAAWNAVDDSSNISSRPHALHAYPCVSVRGAHRAHAADPAPRS